MKNIKLSFFIILATLIIICWAPSLVEAALVPSLTLYPTVGSSVVQTTIIGADPNVSVLLYYPSDSVIKSLNIGTTNNAGYLNTTVDSTTYGIAVGGQVYVKANSQSSQSVSWPSYASSGNLPLSQTSFILSTGQNIAVTASVSANITITNNTNSSVASATVSGNQINITALNLGTSTINVCATNIGCNTININVVSLGSSPASIYLSQNNLSLTPGQNKTVPLSGSGNYSISLNSNPGVASASVNGSNLNITAIYKGKTDINICASGTNNSVTCSGVSVTVTEAPVTANTTQPTLSLAQSQVNLTVGQNQSVAINGSGPFSITANSNPSAVTAFIGANNDVGLHGIAFGGANITVCQFVTSVCANVYAYVQPVGSAGTSSTEAPSISSFSVTSNNTSGSLMRAGNTLTITFNINQTVVTPKITVAGSSLKVNGSGSGPYTASYLVTGNETQPIQTVINFNNSAGSGGQISFSFGVPSITKTATNTTIKFTQYLYVGSTGEEVTALQKYLTENSFYSGPITGKFGGLTQEAVKKYQAKHNLSQLGVVGPATRALLNK